MFHQPEGLFPPDVFGILVVSTLCYWVSVWDVVAHVSIGIAPETDVADLGFLDGVLALLAGAGVGEDAALSLTPHASRG